MARADEARDLAARPGSRQADLALRSGAGRWLVAAAALASGLAFLDSTAVNAGRSSAPMRV